MSIHVITRVMQHSRQRGPARMVLTVIAEHADKDGWCYPGIARIAALSGYKERHTRNLIAKLEAAGELYVHHHHSPHRPNQYLVTVGLDVETLAQLLLQTFPAVFDARAARVMALILYARCNRPGPTEPYVNTCSHEHRQSCDAQRQSEDSHRHCEDSQRHAECRLTEENQSNRHEPEEGAPLTRPAPALQEQENARAQDEGKPPDTSLPTPHTPRDPLLDHPAVQAYRQWVHLTPNDEQRRQIANAISQTSDALARWAEVLQDWRLHGWRPQNVGGMLDRYRGGTPDGRASNRHPYPHGGSAAARRVQALRTRIETHSNPPPVINNKVNLEQWGCA